jgi:hypothetical protein
MGCGGACSIDLGTRALAARAAPPRSDGHCCAECADDADRAARAGANPMLRIVHRVPMGVTAAPVISLRPSAAVQPSAAPMHAHHHRRRFEPIDVASYLHVMGWQPQSWCAMTPAARVRAAREFEDENPGAIGDVGRFIAGMNAQCEAIVYASGELRASGDPTWSASGVYYTYGTDANGVTWDYDANGNPIAGSGATADGTAVPDSQYTGAGVTYGHETTPGAPGGPPATSTAAQQNQLDGLWRVVGGLIGAAGTDIGALIAAGNQQALANINSQLQQALHAPGVDPVQQSQIQQTQALIAALAPKPGLSTTEKIVGGIGIGAAVLFGLSRVL